MLNIRDGWTALPRPKCWLFGFYFNVRRISVSSPLTYLYLPRRKILRFGRTMIRFGRYP